jgi:glycosyltransferase involved in cell wall biosynthesis
MKIFHIGANPSGGGVLNYINTLSASLGQIDEQAKIYLLTDIKPVSDAIKRVDKSIIQVSIQSQPNNVYGLAMRILVVCKTIRSIRPDIVHLHTTRDGIVGVIAIFLLGSSVPVLYTGHSWNFTKRKNPVAKNIVKLIEKIIVIRADFVVCITKSELWQGVNHLRCNKEKIRHVRTHVALPKLDQLPDLSNHIQKFLTSKDVVVCAAEVSKRKNPFLFLELAKRILSSNDQVRFIWIGNGPLLENLRNSIKSQNLYKYVMFPGSVDRPEALKIIHKSSVFLFTSQSEGFPLALIESMILKTIVMTVDYDGFSEIVQHEETGLVFSSNDLDQAVAMAQEYLTSIAKRNTIVESAYAKANKEHGNVIEFAHQYHQIYLSLLQKQS